MILRMVIFLLFFGGCSLSISATPLALEVLEKNCVECHNSHEKKGGVALDQGPLDLDDLQLIIDVVSGPDAEMPPKRDPLSGGDIEALRQWVESGAEIPTGRTL
ncbi:MAG: cytochrome c, partial [Verrucomicrobiota bacterium]